MKALITGGAGYVGVVLAAELLDRGYQVTIVDNFLYGHESIAHLAARRDLTLVRRDVREDLTESLRTVDIVYHLAGISGFPACKANPTAAQEINVGATKRLVASLSLSQLFVYASTTSLYGKNESRSDEEAPVQPLSLYAHTKHAAEQLVMERQRSVALRLATIFGVSPKMRSDLLVNEFVWRAIHERSIVLFESSAKRTFLHVRDGAKAYLLAAERPVEMSGKIFNVGSERLSVSKREIASLIEERTGCTVIDSSIKDLDGRDFRLSFDRIERLGYRPEVSLADGIDELIRLYKVYSPLSHFRVI